MQIPHLTKDPVASIAIWPIDIRLGRVTCHIPPMSAADWLALLMDDFALWDILPGLCPDQEDEIVEELMESSMTSIEFRDACFDVLTEATGRSWWIALRLIAVATESWETVGGRLACSSIHATHISLGAWLDAVLIICLESMPEDRITMFMSQLESPPTGMDVAAEVEEMSMSRSSFMALGR